METHARRRRVCAAAIVAVAAVLAALLFGPTPAASGAESIGAPWDALTTGRFAWRVTVPFLGPQQDAPDPQVALKDPTIVRHDGRWHMFCTLRMASGKVDIVYLNFADWDEAKKADRTVLHMHDQYYCAPQVFYFRPHQRWYLVYQMADKEHAPPFGPAFSTTEDLGDPASWSKPQWLFPDPPEGQKWLDFWVICDGAKAHLFFTSLDGRMWRSETGIDAFPRGWSAPEVAIRGDVFEASHTYKLRGKDQYLTIIEAQGERRRYYKAYLADRLEGPWRGLADSREQPFAAASNVAQSDPWTTNISHGELVRAGVDERMEIDPADVRFVFQGADDDQYRSNPYGRIPWRLGILTPAR